MYIHTVGLHVQYLAHARLAFIIIHYGRCSALYIMFTRPYIGDCTAVPGVINHHHHHHEQHDEAAAAEGHTSRQLS